MLAELSKYSSNYDSKLMASMRDRPNAVVNRNISFFGLSYAFLWIWSVCLFFRNWKGIAGGLEYLKNVDMEIFIALEL